MNIENVPSPLYFKIKNDLLNKIRNQTWQVEEQIPTEQELMDQYQVGRETIRKSIDMLVREGYLYKKRGIGTYVKTNAPTLTLEPLISLSYLFASRGFHEKTYITEKETRYITEELHQLTGISIGERVLHINRKRTVDDYVLALESSYFIYSDKARQYDFQNSITRYLFDHMHLHLSKINQTFTKRKPTKDECEQLSIPCDFDIIELERWSYMEEASGVYFYVKLIILTDIYNYSF